MAMKTLLQPAIGSIKSTLAQMKAKSFHACPVAMRHAPLPEKEYVEVLVDSGMQGRMFRALVNLTENPASTLRITNVSGFQKSERNMFAAFAEALEYRVVDKIKGTDPYYIGKGIGDSEFAIKRRGRIENLNAYYYLAPYHETDVVLAPEACECCFDLAYLDYMKSCFELMRQGALLIIRFSPMYARQFLASPFIDWMQEAGFDNTWFFGADNIHSWEEQVRAGKGFSLAGESQLLVLSDAENEGYNMLRYYEAQLAPKDVPLMKDYLVFQRAAFPEVSAMLSLFSRIMGWEGDNMGHRIGDKAGRFCQAVGFLASFRESLPSLMREYEARLP